MNSVQKIAHKQHNDNNVNQVEFFKKTLINRKNARIKRINDKLEIALWNMEKHLKDFEKMSQENK